jgi:hypothetical protein
MICKERSESRSVVVEEATADVRLNVYRRTVNASLAAVAKTTDQALLFRRAPFSLSLRGR